MSVVDLHITHGRSGSRRLLVGVPIHQSTVQPMILLQPKSEASLEPPKPLEAEEHAEPSKQSARTHRSLPAIEDNKPKSSTHRLTLDNGPREPI